MSIFGNFGNTNTNTSGNVFGAQNTNQPAAGSSLFGSTNSAANPTSSPFGATNTNTASPAAGNIFGAFGTPASNTTNQPASGNSLFGNNTTNTNTGSSLFGNAANNTNANATGNAGTTTGSSIFGGGGTTGTSNLFGNNTTTANPLFGGATNTATNTGTGTAGTTGGSIFGGGNTTNTGGGLFGSTTNNTTNTGGGLFGSTANNTQQQQTANTGTGLFGGATNSQPQTGNTAGTGLFGNTQNTGSSIFGAKPATGLFGSTTTTPTTNTNTGSIFGGGLFGGQQQQQQNQQQQPQQQPQQSSLFGSSTLFGGNKSTLGTSALGAPAQQNVFGTSTLTTPSNMQDAQNQFSQLAQKIERIINAWNQESKDCEFQHNFYNLVDPKQVNLYGRPANATNDAMWEKAVRENPDPSCLVPVIAIGFDDLRVRVDAQTAQSANHLQNLKDLQTRLAALRTQHAVSNASRLLRAASTQTQVIQRLMRFIQHLHLLIPTIRSSALRPEEEALRGKLEELEEEMRRGRVKGRLNELWALIGSVSASIERSSASGTLPTDNWAVVDEDGLAQIAQILTEQQAGLQHLTKILQKSQRDLNVIMGNSSKNTAESTNDETGAGLGESIWGSTSMLRASALR
ncbi:Nucleoporin nup44 [Psilocybe cubensis]|uniref:Nucleoporin Nup54 alpha-helical domain-containing protein n=2 Tax=Psilocybe cubensis TaxID=181762 RepID=A0A8H8CHC2_PSICU|nr:Nucleoporin nup44 [Psilocybe cubensis]KAH9474431.1 Nucleoporin nup44 [Psilocybe cubensis]